MGVDVMRRAKEMGYYLYCSRCGSKLYTPANLVGYWYCEDCGYIQNRFALTNAKNVREMDVSNAEGVMDWE